MSLERKLPLLMTVVLATVLAAALFLTYRTLSHSAETTARERLLSAAQSISGTVEAAIQDRAARLRELSTDSAFAGAARRGDQRRLMERIQRFRGSGDSTLAIEAWNARRARTGSLGPELNVAQRGSAFPEWLGAAASAALVSDSATFSPLYEWNGRVFFWAFAPVRAGREVVGYVAQQRRTGGPQQAVASLRGLIGEDVTLQLRNRDGSFWSSAPGRPGTRPQRRDSTPSAVYDVLPSGERLIVAESAVRGAPWLVVLHAPRDAVLARPRATLLRLLLLGGVLAAVGALLSWGISRRITRPLASLTIAAEAVARGQYDRRVGVHGHDEVARLAASFNQMAEDIAVTHRELERRTTEAELAREDAERANRAKADFLAVMSHELRTPLTAISGYSDLLQLGIYGPLTDAQRDALTRIVRNQDHVLALIKDVLNFAKIEAGQVQYDIRDVVVDEVLSGVEPLIAPQLRAKGLEFVCLVCDPRVTVRADRDRLQQILINLLANAIKFTPAGGRITLECDARPHDVRIRVADTGAGIAAERLPLIFEPFVQGHRALNRPHEGVGLGLAISRDLALDMGAQLAVESEVGRGSVFTLVLARGALTAPPSPQRQTAPAAV